MAKYPPSPLKAFLPLIISLTLVAGFRTKPPIARTSDRPAAAKVEYVYICGGPKSVVYHASEECRGLSHCSTKVDKVTISDAIRMGRRPCKIEYK